jgi:hypothetical protein
MPDFDWVNALSACSAVKVFQELIMQAKDDVNKRKAQLRQGGNEYSFETAMNKDDLKVFVMGNKISGSVTLSCRDGEIVALNHDDKVMFAARPTLNDEGECRLRVNGKECELWQVRKMALEELFFRRYY